MFALLDWLDLWSLPAEPIDFDVAVEVMARKFESLCEDADWMLYAIGKWPDEVFDLLPYLPNVNGQSMPEWMAMMQQVEHFKEQGVTTAEMARLPRAGAPSCTPAPASSSIFDEVAP
jgi:hypothetical protein